MSQEQPNEQTINIDAIRLRHSDMSRVTAQDIEVLSNALITLSNRLKDVEAENKALKEAQAKTTELEAKNTK